MFALMQIPVRECDNHTCGPQMIGLTRNQTRALDHVVSNPERNSAHYYPLPQNDDITNVEMVLDFNSLSEDASSVTHDEEISDIETQETQETQEIQEIQEIIPELPPDVISDYDSTDDNCPIFVVNVRFSDESLKRVIYLCDDVYRFRQHCREFEIQHDKIYHILDQFLMCIEAFTSPILLRRFVVRVPHNRLCCQSLLFLLLEVVDSMVDSIETYYDKRPLRRNAIKIVLDKLFSQMADIRDAAENCASRGCTYR